MSKTKKHIREEDLFFKYLVKFGLAKFLEKAVKELGNGTVLPEELPEVMVINIDCSQETVKVVTPCLDEVKRENINDSSYGMDYRNHELLIKTVGRWRVTVWRRTELILRF